MRIVELRSDSITVQQWIDVVLSGWAHLQTEVQLEMLIRRHVEIIQQLATELDIDL